MADGADPFASLYKTPAHVATPDAGDPFGALYHTADAPQSAAAPTTTFVPFDTQKNAGATKDTGIVSRLGDMVSSLFSPAATDVGAPPIPANPIPSTPQFGAMAADAAAIRPLTATASAPEQAVARGILGTESGLAQSGAEAANTLALLGGAAIGAPNLAYSSITGNNLYTQPQDWLFNRADAAQAFADQQQKDADSLGTAGHVGGGIGNLVGTLAQLALAPEAKIPEALEAKAAKSIISKAVAHAIAHAPGAVAVGGAEQGVPAAQKTLQAGGTEGQALGELAANAGIGTGQLLAPMSAPGNVLVRALTGEGVQQGLSLAQQAASHAIAPQAFGAAKAPDVTDPMTYLGAALGAVMGPRGARAEAPAMDTSGIEAALKQAGFTQEQIDALKADGSVADIAKAATPAPAQMLPAPEPITVDPRGNAVTPQQAAERAQRLTDLGLTPDVQHAQAVRQEGVKAAEAEALQRGTPGESPKPEDRPAPAAQPAPELAQAIYSHLPEEIGWEQEGGRLLRAGNETQAGVDDMLGTGPDIGRAGGDVVGRTSWIARPSLAEEGESTFWRNRPANAKVSQAGAAEAFRKEAAGEPLKPIEQRFIDYAHQHAQDVAQTHADEMARQEAIQRDMDEESRVAQRQAWRDDGVNIPPADEAEALTLQQWAERAHNAGVDPADAIWAAHATPDPREQAQRFALLIAEKRHGAEQGTATGNHRVGVRAGGTGRTLPDAEAGAGIAEPPRSDLFAAPTAGERIRAASGAKDAERNGLTGTGRTDIHAGDGTLFEGRAPEQASLSDTAQPRRFPTQKEAGMYAATLRGDARVHKVVGDDGKPAWEVTQRESSDVLDHAEPKPVDEIPEDQLSPADRELVQQTRARATQARDNRTASETLEQESRQRGEQEAGTLGLRGAVVEALGPDRAGRLHFVHDEDGLPADVRGRGMPIKRGNVRYGLHTRDGDTYIFTKTANTPERAAWTAIHEVGGHEGFQKLAEAHPDVKVGTRTVKEAHAQARERALQNPTVRKLAEVIAKQRGSKDLPRMAEEAMAELQAAQRTGNWDEIARKYGVEVPKGVREGVKGAIANFVRRMKAILNAIHAKVTGKTTNPFSDADVHDMLDSMWEAAKGERGAAGEQMDQQVFHGSPHRGIEKEGFKLNKIGTGEGNQSYGWGIYFADKRDIADHYRKYANVMGGVRHANLNYAQNAMHAMFLNRKNAGLPRSEALRQTIEWGKQERQIGPYEAARFDPTIGEGQLYHAEIPEDKDLLDWDKPLREQPEKVRAALAQIGRELPDYAHQQLVDNLNADWGDLSGREAYKFLSRLASEGDLPRQSELADAGHPDRAAAEFLNAHGIPGLRYLDGSSRGNGDGSHNYVIWDEAHLNNDVTPYYSEEPADRGISGAMSKDDYHGLHRPPGPEDGAPLHDLTGGGKVYPDDIYGPHGAEYYGHYGGGDPRDRETMAIIHRMHNRPNAAVKIYRAVPHNESEAEELQRLQGEKQRYMARRILPKGIGDRSGFAGESEWYEEASRRIDQLKAKAENGTLGTAERHAINPGDWVTVNRGYAREHGEGALGGNYKIVSKTVKAKDVFTNGDSIHEFGYWPDESGPSFSEEPESPAHDATMGRGASGAAPESVTGVKNAQTAKERMARGLEELHAEGKRDFGTVWETAAGKLHDEPMAGQLLAEEIVRKPRPLEPEETALLAQDRARILVDRRKAAQESIDVGSDETGQAIAQAKLDLANRQLDVNDKAARQSGYEQGLGLAMRKAMATLDYSLDAMEQRMEAAKGRPLTPQEHKTLADLDAQLRAADDKVQVAKGATRKPTEADLGEQLRLFRDQLREADNKRDQTRQKQLYKQIREIAARIASKDFAKPTKREPFAYNAETRRLEAERNHLRRRFDRLAERARMQQWSVARRSFEFLYELRRAIILSGFHTLGKLTTAALYRVGLSPLEHLIQHGLSAIPGIHQIAARAPVEGGFSPGAEMAGLRALFSKDTLKEMGRKFGDRGTYDLLYGKSHASLYPWLDLVGQVHGALKVPEERAAFTATLTKLLKFERKQAKKQGLTELQIADHLARPDVQTRLEAAAYVASRRAIFMQENAVVSGMRGLEAMLRNAGKNKAGGKLLAPLADVMRWMFPIVRVPSNYIGEAFSYLGGGIKAAAELKASGALKKGIDSLTPEQADYIMRNLGKQTLGAALLALGYFGYDAFPGQLGTWYQQGDNKRKNVPHEGSIFGVPQYLAEHPAFFMITLGANFRRVVEGVKNKNGSTMVGTGTVGDASLNSLIGLLRETPFMYPFENLQDKTRNVSAFGKFVADQTAGSFVPPDLRRFARARDVNRSGEPVRRYPRGFVDALKMDIPGLREQVPTKRETRPRR